jgi:hypothetical protein
VCAGAAGCSVDAAVRPSARTNPRTSTDVEG